MTNAISTVIVNVIRLCRRFLGGHALVIFISIGLFFVPFFWFKPGELNIGGDGGRLYFYDPIHIFRYLISYYIMPFGEGTATPLFHYLPLVLILTFVKFFISSPYILIALYSSMKVVVSFLAVYGIIREFIYSFSKEKKENKAYGLIASVLGGLFYVFNPAMTENYVRALPSHDQVFLNPFIFYLVLRYMHTSKLRFLFFSLIISLIFSHNFQTSAAPPFFAFYPLGLLFLFLYKSLYNVHVSLKNFIWVAVLFFGLHAFHILPELADFFASGSNINIQVFDKANAAEMLGYFFGVMPYTKVSFHWLAFSSTSQLGGLTLVIPMICIFGLFLNQRKEKLPLLTGIFFLITLYLVTAQITGLGILLYQYLFKIPGFTMFKNFYGQWQFVFYFFYSLFLGQTIYLLMKRIRVVFSYIFFLIISLFLIFNSWLFVNGELVNQLNTQSNTKVGVTFDPKYEESLEFIRALPNDGKVLVLPFSDSYFQVVHGLNNGAYVGHSMIGQLTGKKDFAGYMDMAPYSDIFWKLSKEQRYAEISRVFGLLNILYVYYNSDPLVYDSSFLGFPYSPDYVRKFMPKDQEDYKKYIDKLPLIKLFDKGTYTIYKVDPMYALPHMYAADQVVTYVNKQTSNLYNKASSFIDTDMPVTPRTVYIESRDCKFLGLDEMCPDGKLITQTNSPTIRFQKINPVLYKVTILNAQSPFFLVFSESFHKNWKLYMTNNDMEKKEIVGRYLNGQVEEQKSKNVYFNSELFQRAPRTYLQEGSHVVANGYANAWYITPSDTLGASNYELSIEFVGQRLFYSSVLITAGFVIIMAGLILFAIKKKTF